MEVNRTLGDQDGIAAALSDLGRMKLQRALSDQDAALFQEAFAALAESHAIFNRIGRLDGICAVGTVLAQALALEGRVTEARAMLGQSLAGFRRLDQPAMIRHVEELLRGLPD